MPASPRRPGPGRIGDNRGMTRHDNLRGITAMLLALAVGPGRPLARLGRIALFLGAMVGLAQVAVWLWGPQNGNPGPVLSLLWTGKGTAEGWAGFSMVKVELLWAGMAQYLAGGANIADPAALKPILREMLATTFCIAVVAVLSLLILWRDRASPQTRVMPGSVKPCSGPTMCTMPWRLSFSE